MAISMDVAWKKKRDEWTTARAKTPVKKGAVSGVNLGESIDKVYAASKKGYLPLLAAIAGLEKSVATYRTKGGKAVAPVSGWLGSLSKDLAALKAAAEADALLLKLLGPQLTKFHRTCYPGVPDTGMVPATKKLMDEDKTGKLTWLGAAKQTKLYDRLPYFLRDWSTVITNLRTKVHFQVELPGKKADYDLLTGRAEYYYERYLLLKAFTTIKTIQDHGVCVKAAQDPFAIMGREFQQPQVAIASLLGK
jgi:hypothetical protein